MKDKYFLNVNIRNEDELRSFVESSYFRKTFDAKDEPDICNYIREAMKDGHGAWCYCGDIEYINLFLMSSDYRDLLDRYLPVCLSKDKRSRT